MDKSAFMEAIQPAITYYGKDRDPELLKLYFEELGGFKPRDLENAVRGHIATSRYFPKIPELRKRITGTEDREEQRTCITMSAELSRHHEICEHLFDNPDYEHEPTDYPVQRIVDAARAAYVTGIERGSDERRERRYVSSAMWAWNIRAMEGERLR